MAVVAFDTFQRANENPLNPTNWTTVPSEHAMAVVSDACVAGTAASQCDSMYTGVSISGNQWAQVTLNNNPGSTLANVYVWVRVATGLDAYQLTLQGNGNWTIKRFTNGGSSTISNGSGLTVAANDVIYLSANGSTIMFKHNGSTVSTVTDGSVPNSVEKLIAHFV